MTIEARTLQRLRQALPAMQSERDALPPDSVFRPSKMWQEFELFLRYIFDLSDRNLRNIRFHTGFMTGVLWFGNFGSDRFETDEEKYTVFPHIREYERFIAQVPERFWGSEPVTTPELERVGIRYKDRLITEDLVRYQRCLSNLYWSGVYGRLDGLPGRPVMVEIGAGYGGMAHQIVSSFGKACTYVIFDIPEILYWSAAFLTVNNPRKRIYIYTPDDGAGLSMEQICADYDFVMLPNYAFDRLAEVGEIHLAVNLLSFQEMTDAQVEHYASGLAAGMRGAIYSENFGRHPSNDEMKATVDAHLSRWFDLIPDPTVLRRLYPNANSWMNPELTWQLFTYVGTPRRQAAPLCPVDRVFHTSDRRLHLD